jgi:hypothetical protein
MSYDISLCDPVTHETLEADSAHFIAGGTRAIGGTTELSLKRHRELWKVLSP